MNSHPPTETNATQPILCCVGLRVAGKPTQFLMERAIASYELDWRAITVEICKENLAAALTGMYALNFMAVRFFPSLHELVLAEVDVQDQKGLSFVGAITSASWSKAGWQVWHNWGFAVQHWSEQQVNFSKSLCWLHGDCCRSRSMLYAMQELRAPDQLLPNAVIWTDPPSDIPPELLILRSGEDNKPVHCVAPENALDVLHSTISGSEIESVLVVGDELPEELEHKELQSAPILMAVSEKASESAVARGLTQPIFLNEVDQIIACEAYDFKRWTGCPVEHAVMRDAYDEYFDI